MGFGYFDANIVILCNPPNQISHFEENACRHRRGKPAADLSKKAGILEIYLPFMYHYMGEKAVKEPGIHT